MSIDWFAVGHTAYPQLINRPPAGGQSEIDYSKGWIAAQNEEQCDDQDWAYGRDTYAVSYQDKK